MKLGLVCSLLLMGCAAKAAPVNTSGGLTAKPEITEGAKATMCQEFVEQAITLYSTQAADEYGLPTDKTSRATFREMYKQELEREGKLQKGLAYCISHVAKDYDAIECAAGALTVQDFDQCLGQ